MSEAVVIAVDGPAAAGKGTLARRLADHLGLRYLDSGRLYRAVAAKLLRGGGNTGDTAQAIAAAGTLTAEDLAAPGLRDETIGQAASVLASLAEVRAALLYYQRDFAAAPPGAVIDGRDIGSVVFPEATHKLFVTATLEVRVARRWAELAVRGAVIDRTSLRREMAARDARDRKRDAAPLVAADDAHVLDTSQRNADAAFNAALALIGR